MNYFAAMKDLLEGRVEVAREELNACLEIGLRNLPVSAFARAEVTTLAD
jgi:hypothetical protein